MEAIRQDLYNKYNALASVVETNLAYQWISGRMVVLQHCSLPALNDIAEELAILKLWIYRDKEDSESEFNIYSYSI
jgi:hypothetical protein